MDEIKTSLIVLGRGEIIKTSFDRPVSVQGKSIGLKSVSFPNIEPPPIRYKFRVLDSRGKKHILTLPPYRWVVSDELMGAIYEALLELYERLDTANQQTYIIDESEVEVTNIRKPHFMPARMSRRGFTAIYYGDSGLKIVPRKWAPDDDVFSILKNSESFSDDTRFAYRAHEITLPEPDLKLTTEPAFLFCDAIKPTYIGDLKRRVLDVVDVTYSGNNGRYFSNSTIQFHEFAVDKLMDISFYFLSIYDGTLNFIDPVVIHLIVK